MLTLIADLSSPVKDGNLLARTGADEFAILCRKVVMDETEAERLAYKLLHELQLPSTAQWR